MIKVHQLMENSRVNGPGNRFVLWVQGCPFDCLGCFNGKAQEKDGGISFEAEELFSRYTGNGVEGVTISGGEPLLQAAQLIPLIKMCKTVGLNIMVYTGFQFEELKKDLIPQSREFLREIDLLVDGSYKQDIPPDGEWVGSGNQRVIALSLEGMNMKSRRSFNFVEQEYVISAKGNLSRTGI